MDFISFFRFSLVFAVYITIYICVCVCIYIYINLIRILCRDFQFEVLDVSSLRLRSASRISRLS